MNAHKAPGALGLIATLALGACAPSAVDDSSGAATGSELGYSITPFASKGGQFILGRVTFVFGEDQYPGQGAFVATSRDAGLTATADVHRFTPSRSETMAAALAVADGFPTYAAPGFMVLFRTANTTAGDWDVLMLPTRLSDNAAFLNWGLLVGCAFTTISMEQLPSGDLHVIADMPGSLFHYEEVLKGALNPFHALTPVEFAVYPVSMLDDDSPENADFVFQYYMDVRY
jgi:hypothetical protein